MPNPGSQNFIEAGMSSATERRAQARADKKRQLEAEQAAHMTPGADIIIDWIDAELAKVCDLREMILHVADKDLARDELIARKLHMDFLTDLKSRAKNMVRIAGRESDRARKVEAQIKREMRQESDSDA